jgi:hypothetical protein
MGKNRQQTTLEIPVCFQQIRSAGHVKTPNWHEFLSISFDIPACIKKTPAGQLHRSRLLVLRANWAAGRDRGRAAGGGQEDA